MRILNIFVAAVFLVTTAAADTLTLKNGTSVEGTFLGGNSREVEFLQSNGSVKRYPVANIAELSFSEVEKEVVTAPRAPRPGQSSGDFVPSGTAATNRSAPRSWSSSSTIRR